MLTWLRKEKCLKKSDHLAKSGKTPEAISLVEQTLQEIPHPDLKKQKAWLLKESGQFEAAITYLNELIAKKEYASDAVLHLILGEALLALKKYEDALTSFRQALTLGGENIWADYLIGRTYVGLGQLEKATECFSGIVKYDANFYKARILTMAETIMLQK